MRNIFEKLIVICCLVLGCTMCTAQAGGDTLPVYEDFSSADVQGLEVVKATPWSEYHGVRINNGQLVLSVNNSTEQSWDMMAQKNLKTAVPYGKLNVEFDFSVSENGKVMNYFGLPYFEDSEGNSTAIMSFPHGMDGKIVVSNGNELFGTSFKSGTTYNVKVSLDINAGTYELYINGSKQYDKKFKSVFPYNGKDFVSVGFNLTCSGQQTDLYVDNLKIYRSDVVYLYASGEGDDSKDGSRENPVRTLTRVTELARQAVQNGKEVKVMLMSGEYDAEGFNYGKTNLLINPEKIVFYPVYGAEVKLTNNRIILPELQNMTVSDEIKEKVLSKVENNYINNVGMEAPKIGEYSCGYSDGNVVITLPVLNMGSVDYGVSIFSAVYNSSGALVDVYGELFTIKAGTYEQLEMNHKITENADLADAFENGTHKVFVWDNLVPVPTNTLAAKTK